MKKVLLIPDSFKGTMESGEICAIMEERVRRYYPEAQVVSIPVADGGEGSVDAFLAAMEGEKVAATVQGPYGEEMEAFYGLVEGGKTAVIEMAACAGLPLVGENRQAHRTTTYGVGQLMAHALERGCRKMIVGLGGSATNDLGAGAAAALGVRFYNSRGETFVPVGDNLGEIARMDGSGLHPGLNGVELVTMCDIDNPLFGENGAAHVFAPQKGADPAMVEHLDRQLRAAAEVVRRDLGRDVAEMPGAGAAGGMGGGMVAFFGSRLQMGIETVLDTVGFDRLLEGADLVFTGEGRIDGQSLRGKVVIGVARRARKKGVPVVAVVGAIGEDVEGVYEEGVSAVFSINRAPVDFSVSKGHSRENLGIAMDNLVRLCKRMGL